MSAKVPSMIEAYLIPEKKKDSGDYKLKVFLPHVKHIHIMSKRQER